MMDFTHLLLRFASFFIWSVAQGSRELTLRVLSCSDRTEFVLACMKGGECFGKGDGVLRGDVGVWRVER